MIFFLVIISNFCKFVSFYLKYKKKIHVTCDFVSAIIQKIRSNETSSCYLVSNKFNWSIPLHHISKLMIALQCLNDHALFTFTFPDQ